MKMENFLNPLIENQFHFTLIRNTRKHVFSMSSILTSLSIFHYVQYQTHIQFPEKEKQLLQRINVFEKNLCFSLFIHGGAQHSYRCKFHLKSFLARLFIK